jgi:translocation and assembly module TamB
MRRTILALALALAAAAAPALPAGAQPDDRGILTRFIEDNLSAAGRRVTIEGFEGALAAVARIDRLTIADDAGVWLSLRGVELDWNRLALLRGRLEVNRLVAAEIEVARAPLPGPRRGLPAPEATPFALPDLPVAVAIGRIAAARVTLGPTLLGEPVVLGLKGALRLAGGEGEARLTAARIDGRAGRIALSGSYSNATRILALELAAAEAAGGIVATLAGIPGAPALDLAIAGHAPIDAWDGTIRLASDGAERLAGTVSLRAAAGETRFAVDVAGDLAPLFLPDYRAFFGERIALVAHGRRTAASTLHLDALDLASAQLRLAGSARIAADGLPELMRLDLAVGAGDGAPVLLPLPGGRVRVGGATLALAFDAGISDDWQVTGRIEALEAPAVAIAALDLDGRGRIARDPGGARAADGALRFAAAGLAPRHPGLAEALGEAAAGRLRFDWREGGALRIGELALAGAGYGATGAFTLTAAGRPAIEGRLAATVADFARLSRLAGRPLGGAGELAVEGRLIPLDGAFDARASVTGRDLRGGIAALDGLLAGEARLRLDAARDQTGTTLRELALRAGSLSVDAAGTIRSGATELAARASLDDLSVLDPQWGGALTADLRITQAEGTDRLTLSGSARDLHAGIAPIDGLLRGTTQLAADLRRHGGEVTVELLRIDAPAIAAAVSGRLRPDGPRTADLAGSVTLPDLGRLDPRWGGAVTAALRLAVAGGREALTLDADLADLRSGIAAADRLLAGPARLTLAAAREGGVVRLERLRFDGRQVTAEATGQHDGVAGRADVSARLADLARLVPEVPGPVTVAGRIDADPAGYGLDLVLRGPGGIEATAAGRIAPDGRTARLRARGRAEAALATAFAGPVSIRGPVRFDLTLDGPPGLAALGGRMSLDGGRIALLDPPLRLVGVTASADFGGGRADIAARARSEAGGELSLAGDVALAAPHAAALALDLRGFVLRDPALYETSLSGRIGIDGPLAGGARIAGAISLGPTELRIPAAGLGGAVAIPELRHLAEPPRVRETRARAGLLADPTAQRRPAPPRPHALDLRFDAPGRIFVRGRGLDAELGGTLALGGSTAAPRPVGGFELLRGRLDLLGRRFTLDGGRLFLEGDFVPRLELVASARSDGITATVGVEGRADAPTIRFSSVPELPEEEVAARLFFGRGLTSLSAFQAAQLAVGVATLTGRGGAGLVDRLRRGFGLDDLDVQTGADGATAFRAGRYLAENLYADVVVGATGRTEVTLNLDLTRSVTVRGRAGNEGGTGIGIYFERDY